MITKDGQGPDGLGARARFTFSPTSTFATPATATSAYRMQLGIRYSF